MNVFKVTVFGSLLLLLFFGCSTGKSSRDRLANKSLNHRDPNPTNSANVPVRKEDDEILCSRLHEIKRLPNKDPAETDPIYEALISKGNEAILCLVDKITDETLMADPRGAQPWRNYTVGDTAVFILVRIASEVNPLHGDKFLQKDRLLQEMLPEKYQQEWKTNGIYAYFNYVSYPENRKELQEWWKIWVKENLD